jgi:hypothetical protein
MRNRLSKTSHHATPDDVGTLWTMRRGAHTARCALMARPMRWELRVLVDQETLLSAPCVLPGEAFVLAERWKDRLLEQGWLQIVPRPNRVPTEDRQSV